MASGSPEHPLDGPGDEEDAIAINYTSGTTGDPKGVIYTQGAYLNALADVIEAGLTPRSRLLLLAPLFQCNGWCYAWGAVAVGATIICMRRVDPAQIWRLIDDEEVTHFNSAPTVQIAMVNDPGAHRLPSGLTVCTGGSPPSPTLLGRVRELNITPLHICGLTETYAPITRCLDSRLGDLPDEERARLLARQGQAHVTADLVRVVDEEMHEVPRDGETLGEVVMRGNIVMGGYFRDPEATAVVSRPDEYWASARWRSWRRGPAWTSTRRRSSSSAGSTWRTTSARRRSASGSCPRPRPARCRSTCSARTSGPGTRRASSDPGSGSPGCSLESREGEVDSGDLAPATPGH